MKEEQNNVFLIIGVVVLIIWLAALTYGYASPIFAKESEGSWKCNLVNCTNFIDGYAWSQQNCFDVGNGTQCKITQNGVNQLIPIEYLNLSAIQQCTNYNCVEEVKVRQSNYQINISQ